MDKGHPSFGGAESTTPKPNFYSLALLPGGWWRAGRIWWLAKETIWSLKLVRIRGPWIRGDTHHWVGRRRRLHRRCSIAKWSNRHRSSWWWGWRHWRQCRRKRWWRLMHCIGVREGRWWRMLWLRQITRNAAKATIVEPRPLVSIRRVILAPRLANDTLWSKGGQYIAKHIDWGG